MSCICGKDPHEWFCAERGTTFTRWPAPVTKTADANLLAEPDPRDGECTVPGCKVCLIEAAQREMARTAREAQT